MDGFSSNDIGFHCEMRFIKKVGKYEFKYIVDGNWCTNPDASSTQPNNDGHVNNFIEVLLFVMLDLIMSSVSD